MLVWNILTTFVSRSVIVALALASSVVLARSLGPDGRGLFALVLLLPELARSFALLGIEQSNAVYAGLEPSKRHVLVWHSAIIAAAVGGAVAIVGICFLALGAPGFPALLRGPLWLYWIPLSIVPMALASEFLGAILRGMNRIFVLNILDVAMKVGSFILVICLVGWLRLDVAGAVWTDFVINVTTMLVTVGLIAYAGALGPPAFDRSLLSRTAKFALLAHCNTVISYLNYRIDQLFIAAWLPTEQLGYYVIAVGLAERLWLPTGAVANALLPHLTNSPERHPELSAILARHVILWVGGACLVVFVLADVLIDILYSPTFASTVAPLRWLLPGIFALSVGRVLVAELLARQKPHYMVWASGAATLINIAGNVLLVPRMGISGSAIASSVSYSFLSLFLIRCYLRETGLSFGVLLPRWADLLIYTSLLKIRHLKAGGLEIQSQSSSYCAAVPIPDHQQSEDRFHRVGHGGLAFWLRKVKDFYDHPHFPFFLLASVRMISPTLARYFQYGRYNPNTEDYWNERYRSGSYQKEEWRYQGLDQEIVKMIPPGSKVLDAGCGTGRIMEKLRDERDCSCVGIDISDIAISNIRAKGFCGFKCALPDLSSELTHKSFDVCTIMETLEHLSHPEKALQSLSMVLKDGGKFIVSVPDDCMKPGEFDEHVSSFDKQGLCDLLSRNCEVNGVHSIQAGDNDHLIVTARKPRGVGADSGIS